MHAVSLHLKLQFKNQNTDFLFIGVFFTTEPLVYLPLSLSWRSKDATQTSHTSLLKHQKQSGQKKKIHKLYNDSNYTDSWILNVMDTSAHMLDLPIPAIIDHLFLSTPTHSQTLPAPQKRLPAGKDVCVSSPPPHYHIQALQWNCVGLSDCSSNCECHV